MADPRSVSPQERRVTHSPLMLGLLRKQAGDVLNFCPYGCETHEMDEHGYCGHLIGFYNGGQSFEPRVVRKKDKRIIVDGKNRQPMKRGYKLVKITTSARVYSPNKVKELTPVNNEHSELMQEMAERERELAEFAERVRNPVLDGDWEGSVYDPAPVAAAATPKT